MIRPAVFALWIAALGAWDATLAAAPSAPNAPAKDPLAAETAAWTTAKPVFQKYCATCHAVGGTGATKKRLGRFNITSYPIAGVRAATIGVTVREVLGLSGKKPIMPADKPGAVTGADLALIKAWTDAWVAADQAGAHHAAGH